MSIIKAVPLAAAAALVLIAVSSQADAASRHYQGAYGAYAQQPAGETVGSVYRDPTTREALDEGTW